MNPRSLSRHFGPETDRALESRVGFLPLFCCRSSRAILAGQASKCHHSRSVVCVPTCHPFNLRHPCSPQHAAVDLRCKGQCPLGTCLPLSPVANWWGSHLTSRTSSWFSSRGHASFPLLKMKQSGTGEEGTQSGLLDVPCGHLPHDSYGHRRKKQTVGEWAGS